MYACVRARVYVRARIINAQLSAGPWNAMHFAIIVH